MPLSKHKVVMPAIDRSSSRVRLSGLFRWRSLQPALLVGVLSLSACNKDADKAADKPSAGGAEKDSAASKAAPEKPVDLSKPFSVPSPDLATRGPVMRQTLEAAIAATQQDLGNTAKIADLGMLLYVFQFETDAARCFAEAAKREPEELRWPYYMGMALQASGARAQAAAAFERTLALNAEYSAAMTRLGEVLLDSAPASAVKHFEKALTVEIGSPRAVYGLGQCALRAGDKAKAAERFQHAVTLFPEYREAHAALAELIRAEGDGIKADEHLSLSFAGRSPGYANDPLGDDLLRKGRSAPVLTEVALDQLQAGSATDAINSLLLAARLDSNYAMAYQTLGRAWAEVAELSNAESAYRRALELAPDDVNTKAMLADCLCSQRRLDEAAALFAEVLAQKPDHPGTLWRKGRMLRIQGQMDEAHELIKRAVELAPDDAEGRMVYADLLYVKQDREGALQQIDALLKLSPTAWRAYYLKGGIHLEMDDKPAARAAWEKLVELAPTFITGHMQLVSLALAAGDPLQAEKDLRRALLHSPNSATLCNALAWRLAAAADPARRNPKEALRYADKACKLTEATPAPLYLDTLAVVYAQLGRFDDAVNIARQAVDLATKQGDTASAAEYETRLRLFEEKKPYLDKL